MFEVICISFAFVLGLAVRPLGLPPLVGFLAAGFAVNGFGPSLGLPEESSAILEHVAHLGVLMLLFTVGLKLKLEQLVQPQVVGGGLLHFGLSVGVLAPGLRLVLGLPWETALLMATALAFSSTVLAAKILEAKRELRAFHGRVAIGILIVQDLIALAVLSLFGGHTPSPWALLAARSGNRSVTSSHWRSICRSRVTSPDRSDGLPRFGSIRSRAVVRYGSYRCVP